MCIFAAMKKQIYNYDGIFNFEAGGSLRGIGIAYHSSDREYRRGDKVVWITHALTANSDPEDWWSEITGEGKLIDTSKYFVVCVNMLCSPYGSSGPAAVNPETGAPWYFGFPKVTVRDIVNANILVRKHLGIERIDCLIGGSIGGFQAVEWSIMEPGVIAHAVFIATSARVTPWVTAGMECQRLALEADPSFRRAESLSGGAAGLRCARAQALMTYRHYDGYLVRQSEEDEDTVFADRAASYERYQGDKLVRRFDAYSYYYLTYAVDSHNVGRGRGGVASALAQVRVAPDVIAVDSDCLFPVEEQRAFVSQIPGAKLHVIHSLFGHDGFLLEYDQLTEVIRPVLESM